MGYIIPLVRDQRALQAGMFIEFGTGTPAEAEMTLHSRALHQQKALSKDRQGRKPLHPYELEVDWMKYESVSIKR